MARARFDTLKAYQRLKEAGVPSALAEAIVEAWATVLSINWQKLIVEEDSPAVQEGLRREFSDFRKDMALKFEQTTSTLRSEITNSKIELIKWLVGISIVQTGLIIAILKFLPGTI